jgi:acetyl esterase/lipase
MGDSYVANGGRDPLVTRDAITKFNAAYLGATSATDPQASPILADYRKRFVPTIITTGTRDLLQSDSVRFYWPCAMLACRCGFASGKVCGMPLILQR